VHAAAAPIRPCPPRTVVALFVSLLQAEWWRRVATARWHFANSHVRAHLPQSSTKQMSLATVEQDWSTIHTWPLLYMHWRPWCYRDSCARCRRQLSYTWVTSLTYRRPDVIYKHTNYLIQSIVCRLVVNEWMNK